MKKKRIITVGAMIVLGTLSIGMIVGVNAKADDSAMESVAVDERVFPDENFRAYVAEYIDLNQNKILEENEIEACQFVNVYQKGIQSLEGIGVFSNLKSLNCGKNQLTQIDLSACQQLTFLDCAHNNIEKIYMQNNNKLESLICSNNQLTQLELQGKEVLQYLDCSSNLLRELDLSDAISLKEIYCGENIIERLDFSGTPEITTVCCGNGLISSISLQGCEKLQLLECDNGKLQTLDVSDCKALIFLSCNNNRITKLDLEKCRSLNTISCSDNQLEKIEITQCSNLENFNCENNAITGTLDFSGFAMLRVVNCNNNLISEIKCNNCISLYQLCCNKNQLTTLEVKDCKNLTLLQCIENKLTELSLEDCKSLNQEPYIGESGEESSIVWNVVCDADVVVIGVDKNYILTNSSQENVPSIIPTGTAAPTQTVPPTQTVTPPPKTSAAPAVTESPMPALKAENSFYSISYQMKGGKNNTKNPKTYSEKGSKLYEPSRKGYSFGGWYLDSDYKNKIDEIAAGTQGNLTLYAKWKKVIVAKTTLKSVKNNASKKLKIRIKKVSGAKGYQISYAQNKKFKNARTVTTAKTTYSINKLKKGRTYYVKVRAYKYDSARKKVYGTYSNVKKVIIKK